MPPKRITVFHNPACGTSRSVLALLRERGIEPEVIEYLKTPPAPQQLRDMIARSGLEAREFLRKREPLYKELDLDNPKRSEDQIIALLAENPCLLNRPIVDTGKRVRPCRPAEAVLSLLD